MFYDGVQLLVGEIMKEKVALDVSAVLNSLMRMRVML